jgi:hypothetical protein
MPAQNTYTFEPPTGGNPGADTPITHHALFAFAPAGEYNINASNMLFIGTNDAFTTFAPGNSNDVIALLNDGAVPPAVSETPC